MLGNFFLAALFLSAGIPRPFITQSEMIWQGRLISNSGRTSYSVLIDLFGTSPQDEIQDLNGILEVSGFEALSKALNGINKGIFRITGGAGFSIGIRAASVKAKGNGFQYLLAAHNQIVEPGIQKSLKRDRLLAIVLDLDREFAGEGKIYENADIRFSEQGLDLISSPSIPRAITNIELISRQGTKKATPAASSPIATSAEYQDPRVIEALKSLDSAEGRSAVDLLESVDASTSGSRGLGYWLAYAYYCAHDPNHAIRLLEQEIAEYPQELRAPILLSYLRYKEGNLIAAEKSARSFLEQSFEVGQKAGFSREATPDYIRRNVPNAGVPAYILALISIARQDFDKAQEWLNSARAFGYARTDVWVQSVYIACQQGQWREMLRLLLDQNGLRGRVAGEEMDVMSFDPKIRAEDPEIPPEIWLMASISFRGLGRDTESRLALETAESRKPYDAFILQQLAVQRFLDHHREGATALLRRAAALYPQADWPRRALARFEDWPLAEGLIESEALSRDFLRDWDVRFKHVFTREAKDVAEEINQKAMRLIKEGKFTEAAARIQSFVDIYESSPTLHYNLAQLYNHLGRDVEALRYTLRAWEKKADAKDACDLAARVFYRIGDYDAAIRYYSEALRLDPKDALSYYNLGCAFLARSDFDQAETNWQAAVQADNGSEKKAREAINKSDAFRIEVDVRIEPIESLAYRSLGRLRAIRGNVGDAMDCFFKAIHSCPSSPLPYFDIGKLYLEQNNLLLAGLFFRKYVSLGGEETNVRAPAKIV